MKSALDFAHSRYVATVVADDTDILVLLLHHHRSTAMADIFLLSEETKRQRQGIKFINVRRLANLLGETLVSHLLFIHAWSGCDTTFAIFNQGKAAILRKLEKSEEVHEISRLFNCDNVTQEQVAEAGLRLFILMYQAKSEDSLNLLRYARYMHLISDSVFKIKPEILPPTEKAAHFHCLQVYLKGTQWKHLMAVGIDPLLWGWKQVEDKFVPVMTDLEPASPDILNIISCKCKSLSQNQYGSDRCTWKKHGLKCVTVCKECRDDSCQNPQEVVLEDGLEDDDY